MHQRRIRWSSRIDIHESWSLIFLCRYLCICRRWFCVDISWLNNDENAKYVPAGNVKLPNVKIKAWSYQTSQQLIKSWYRVKCLWYKCRKSTDAGLITNSIHQIVHDMVMYHVDVMSARVSVNCDPEARNLHTPGHHYQHHHPLLFL